MESKRSSLNKLYVGGIPQEASENEIRNLFEMWGSLSDLVLIKDKHTKKSRGFGFVTFKHRRSMKMILNGAVYLRERMLEIKVAEPKKSSKLLEIEDTSKITKVFIGGVPKEASREHLVSHFNRYGEIVEASIIEDKKTNEPRGFGFVTYRGIEAVKRVMEDYSTHSILGKWVECKIALPKSSTGESPSNQNGSSDGSNSSESEENYPIDNQELDYSPCEAGISHHFDPSHYDCGNTMIMNHVDPQLTEMSMDPQLYQMFPHTYAQISEAKPISYDIASNNQRFSPNIMEPEDVPLLFSINCNDSNYRYRRMSQPYSRYFIKYRNRSRHMTLDCIPAGTIYNHHNIRYPPQEAVKIGQTDKSSTFKDEERYGGALYTAFGQVMKRSVEKDNHSYSCIKEQQEQATKGLESVNGLSGFYQNRRNFLRDSGEEWQERPEQVNEYDQGGSHRAFPNVEERYLSNNIKYEYLSGDCSSMLIRDHYQEPAGWVGESFIGNLESTSINEKQPDYRAESTVIDSIVSSNNRYNDAMHDRNNQFYTQTIEQGNGRVVDAASNIFSAYNGEWESEIDTPVSTKFGQLKKGTSCMSIEKKNQSKGSGLRLSRPNNQHNSGLKTVAELPQVGYRLC